MFNLQLLLVNIFPKNHNILKYLDYIKIFVVKRRTASMTLYDIMHWLLYI